MIDSPLHLSVFISVTLIYYLMKYDKPSKHHRQSASNRFFLSLASSFAVLPLMLFPSKSVEPMHLTALYSFTEVNERLSLLSELNERLCDQVEVFDAIKAGSKAQ